MPTENLEAPPASRSAPDRTPDRTADPSEVARFAAQSDDWWNPDGPFRPLHALNPVRLSYIRRQCLSHFGRAEAERRPLAGLQLLDVGCGGGLVSEPMCRLGADVVGIDATTEALAAARAHASSQGLAIDYRSASVEDLGNDGAAFDIVLALEVVEHVADLGAFLRALSQVLRPGGMAILSTINRTTKSYALAIVGAEFVLRLVPQGTHDWRKFVRPSELARALRGNGLTPMDLTGARYNPFDASWQLCSDIDVNYFMTASAGAQPAGT